MERIRKSLIWFLSALLICSFLPPGPAQRASAAAAATYFLPDDMTLRNTALLTLDGIGGTMINRGNVYTTTSPTLTITGTFAYVSTNSLSVEVQQLIYQNDRYVPVESRLVTGTVRLEDGSANRFIASNLTLFPGFNRITFSGMQGNIERSETFYVLYDQIPYIQSLVVYGSGTTQIQLNEGADVIVDTRNVTLQGQVQNAANVGVSLNGGTESRATVLENGMFLVPTLVLKPGRNELSIRVSNNSDSVLVERVLYYQDPESDDPFVKLDMDFEGKVYEDVHEKIPVVTNGNTGANDVIITAEILLPVNVDPQSIEYSVDGGSTFSSIVDPSSRGLVGSSGISHQILTFKTGQETLTFNSTGLNDIYLTVRNGTDTWTKRIRFNFQPNETVIKNMYLLPEFDPADPVNSSETKLTLNNRELSSPNFYVLVEKDGSATGTLQGRYQTMGEVTLQHVTVLSPTEEVYEIRGFPSGRHQVSFYYVQDAAYTVTLSYIAKQYIDIDLQDGQVFEFDSSEEKNILTIRGQYIGFEGLTNAQYVVNSAVLDPNDPFYSNNPDYDVELDVDPSQGDFEFELRLPIRPEGPIVYGQNTILFTGTDEVGGIKREIRKEVRIYVIDTNVSTIARFHPVAIPSGFRTDLPDYDLNNGFDPDILEDVFRITPEFAINDGRYVTNETKYDLVIRGHGARYVNLKRGSETILYLDFIDANPVKLIDEPYPASGIRYDFSGNEDDFIVRVKDLEFEEPGTHIYNLELINASGARTSQRLEIEREQSSFRLFAPQPTVGSQIIVNKNFVRIDVEAEGATAVRVEGEEAEKRTDVPNRFVYDYVGLKANKWNDIRIEIVRPNSTIKETIRVYYTGEVKIDSQYMEPLKTKHSVFNKKLELSFPRGTVLMSAMQTSNGVYKYYTDNKLLFGIADPQDGVVARRDDYGRDIKTIVSIPNYLIAQFNSVGSGNFTRISDIYWISGGMGEYGDYGSAGYKPATNGLPPYSEEGRFATSDFEPERKIVPSRRGTLKLSFDENVVDDAAHTVTVFRYTDKGYWENIGGEVDTKNNTITVPFDEFGYYLVAKLKRSYTDIVGHPWARNVLNGLYSKGIMTNLRHDEFGADDVIMRGEFVTLLVKGLNIPLNYDDNNTFTDIQPNTRTSTWSYEYIETAARAGIVTGRSVGYFGAEIPITREDAAVMIARALELKMAANDSKLEASLANTFQDAERIDTYARPAVEAVYKAKIMTGSQVTIPGSNKPGLNFYPKSNLTRAEAAAIAVRMLQRTTKIFPKNFG